MLCYVDETCQEQIYKKCVCICRYVYICVCMCVSVCVDIYNTYRYESKWFCCAEISIFSVRSSNCCEICKIFNYIQVVSLVFEASTKLESYMLYNLLFEDIFKNNWKKFFATHTLLIFQEIKTDKVVNNCEKELLPISSFLLISVC